MKPSDFCKLFENMKCNILNKIHISNKLIWLNSRKNVWFDKVLTQLKMIAINFKNVGCILNLYDILREFNFMDISEINIFFGYLLIITFFFTFSFILHFNSWWNRIQSRLCILFFFFISKTEFNFSSRNSVKNLLTSFVITNTTNEWTISK